jgi:hypothetical protein
MLGEVMPQQDGTSGHRQQAVALVADNSPGPVTIAVVRGAKVAATVL